MGFRASRSTETALDLLTSQIRTVWESKRHVASVLSFDISGAFDSVVPARLVDILRKKGFPFWILRFIASFTSDRETTLALPGGESEVFQIGGGVPQGSPLSVILFLFYNSELFNICRQQGAGVQGLGFADDFNALAYSVSTKENCRKLKRLHQASIAWAKRHGIRFAPDKYELIHFTKARRFDLGQGLDLGEGIVKLPAKEVKVLGVILDSKLQWTAHARALQVKASQQLGALTRISASTWGPSFRQARQVYLSVVRPAITYASPIWYDPSTKSKTLLKTAKAEVVQNKALRNIAGAYKATATEVVESEVFVPPLNLYLD
jgi:Reverse transcriptase (RNA-dependent DNA polymerase)